jgi:hypothetical protein
MKFRRDGTSNIHRLSFVCSIQIRIFSVPKLVSSTKFDDSVTAD